jgi:hypothetical protein
MTTPLDFLSWLADNPYPDLQELVAEYGSYTQIPAHAWAAYDLAREDWNARRLERLGGPTRDTRDVLTEIKGRPSRK